MDLDYIKNDVIGKHRSSIRIYISLIICIISLMLLSSWYVSYVGQNQLADMLDILKKINDEVLNKLFLNSESLSLNGKSSFNTHIYYSIVAFLSFSLFLMAGLIKFHVGEIAKAQKVIYGFMRIDRDNTELSPEARNELVKNTFSMVDEKPIEVHAGIDALKSTVETISSNISSIAKVVKK